MTTTARRAGTQTGSSITGPAVVSVGLFVVSLLIGVVFAGSPYSSPFIDDAEIGAFYADHLTLNQFVGFLQLASAIALGVFTGAVWSRLRQLAPMFPALTNIAAVGGVLASVFLALNALIQWTLGHAGVIAEPAVRRGLHYVFFGLGGFAHVAALGVLVAGITIPAMLTGLLPRWFAVASLAVAAISALSTLTMLTESASTLIPIGRFATLIWLVTLPALLHPRP